VSKRYSREIRNMSLMLFFVLLSLAVIASVLGFCCLSKDGEIQVKNETIGRLEATLDNARRFSSWCQACAGSEWSQYIGSLDELRKEIDRCRADGEKTFSRNVPWCEEKDGIYLAGKLWGRRLALEILEKEYKKRH
jgi:hypothetical protein